VASMNATGFEVQNDPKVYCTMLPGKWLLKHSVPSWRSEDPIKGFQRIVREKRAREIAVAVIDQARTFPNAIVLATDATSFPLRDNELTIPSTARFLVVDGQHRLWAQRFGVVEANYVCMLHMGLSEQQMARLFLEINDTQKRVPSSLRWDLVRLVRPDDDPYLIAAADLVYELATDPDSPLYQRIDLTGEVAGISLKQGSLAPELKTLVSTKAAGLRDLSFEQHFEFLKKVFGAIRALDSARWKDGTSPFYSARVLRASLRLLPDVLLSLRLSPQLVTLAQLRTKLSEIDLASIDPEEIRAVQGAAGVKAIETTLRDQLGLKKK
jgi:DGQHR domain-containing protein